MSGIRRKRKKIEICEFRRWEDMEYDCLVNILGRLNAVSLLLDIPFVCKSWYKASLSPSCWKHTDSSELYCFPRNKRNRFTDEYKIKKYLSGLVRLMVSRGQGKSTSLVLQLDFSTKDLKYVAEKCPELKSLPLDWRDRYSYSVLSKLIPNWKNLEELRVRFEGVFSEILAEIGKNCKNFSSLVVNGGWIGKDSALAVAKYLPKLKKFTFSFCKIENLEIIVLGCKELEHLDVGVCEYGHNLDEEKLKELSSHIKTSNIASRRFC